ncbi:MAG TPA: cell division ATP-binding protein FtsE, partial [Miltoncostaeales bacterium]|nr:cell division ATP-binding protein FtsE [Miltoncostaeales bacterium]
ATDASAPAAPVAPEPVPPPPPAPAATQEFTRVAPSPQAAAFTAEPSEIPTADDLWAEPAPVPVDEDAERRAAREMLRPGSGPMVVFDDVSMVYPGNVTALDQVRLSIDPGEFVFLIGSSGSGKSTFIRLLIRELQVTSGHLMVGGRDLKKMNNKKVPYLRREIGCVFQDFKLLPRRTVAENVAYTLEVTGESPRDIRRKVPEILSLVGLAEKAGRFPNELSGGEQQRVSIARAFVNHPSLLIADEPTGNLDPETSIGIMQLLYRINRTGTTVIMATHDRDLVDRMQMRVLELSGGKLVRDQGRGAYQEGM